MNAEIVIVLLRAGIKSMNSRKILITGGTGYIGSHTVIELLASGYEIAIVDNLVNSQSGILERLKEITGRDICFGRIDLLDQDALLAFVKENGPFDGVIHFAALKSVSESVSEPLSYYHNNVGSMISLGSVMRKTGINKIVFSSSCTVYGQPDRLPVDESATFKPAASPYGETKQICERILNDISIAHDIQAVSLRYFNPIGAHPSARIGEVPLSVPSNLVPFLTQTAAGLRPKLTVFGSDYDTHDGTAVRDYIHVMDLARAHVMALDFMDAGMDKGNIAFNIGTGEGYSVLDVIRSFERVSGLKLEWESGKRRPGDIEKIWADPGLANDVLGWKTERGLDEMISSAWEWQKEYIREPIK